MTFAEGAVRFLVGGTLVLLIGIIARNGKSSLAGIIAMFPVITAVSFSFLAQTSDVRLVKDAVLSGIFSLPATLVFLLVFYLCAGRMSFILTLTFSLLAWIAAAVIVYFIKT